MYQEIRRCGRQRHAADDRRATDDFSRGRARRPHWAVSARGSPRMVRPASRRTSGVNFAGERRLCSR